MISQKEVTVKENAKVFLKVTVPDAEVKREYDSLMKEYCDKAVIKGFRRGKVPVDVLERKFGDEIKGETAYNIIRKSLEEVFTDIKEKPLAYAQPEMTDKWDMELGKDFTFEVSYDTYPAVELGTYKGVKAEEPAVAIADEDIQRELDALQEKNSIVKEKKDGIVAHGDIVTVDYVELDADNNPVAETRRDGFVSEVGKNASNYQFDDDLLDMKTDEEKAITKTFAADHEVAHLAGKTVTLKLAVRAIKEKIIPKQDDELAQDISDKFKTLDDLKTDIKTRLENARQEKVKDIVASRIVEKIVETSKIPLPETMVAADLDRSWQDLVERFGKKEDVVLRALNSENKTKEVLFNDWRPGAERKIKAELILTAVEEQEKIEASDADLEEEIKKYATERNLEYDKAKEAYEKMNLMDYLKRSIAREKTIRFLVEHADLKKGKQVKFLDLLQGNY